jgi:hypothetical protein
MTSQKLHTPSAIRNMQWKSQGPPSLRVGKATIMLTYTTLTCDIYSLFTRNSPKVHKWHADLLGQKSFLLNAVFLIVLMKGEIISRIYMLVCSSISKMLHRELPRSNKTPRLRLHPWWEMPARHDFNCRWFMRVLQSECSMLQRCATVLLADCYLQGQHWICHFKQL